MSVEELNALIEEAYAAAFEFEDKLADAYRVAFNRAAKEAAATFRATAVTAAGFVAPPIDSLTSGMTEAEQIRVNRVRDQAAEAIAVALIALGLTAVAVSFMEAIAQRGALNFDQELLRVLRNTVEQGLSEGWTADETAVAIQKTFRGVSSTTAQMLAQTELTSLVNERSLQAAQKAFSGSADPVYKVWQTMKDPRVRPAHAATQGQTVPIAQPFSVGGYAMMYPGDPSAPMSLVARCFPAGTLVAGSIEAAVRSRFDGRMMVLHTRSGKSLSGTENHPVLTLSGWKTLGEINKGDHLVRADFDQRAMPGAFDVEDIPSCIEEVFDSLARSGCLHRVRAVDVDLYGDSLDGDVDVVWADGLLELPCTPSGFKPAEQFAFAHSNEAQATLALLGVEREFSWGGDATSGSSLGFGNARLSFVGTEFAHPHEHRFGATATLDAPFVEPAFDWLPTDSQASGDLLLGEHLIEVESHDLVGIEREPIAPPVNASLLQVIEDGLVVDSELQPNLGGGHPDFVQTDDVVSVDAFTFHGDVFTLSTEQGYYIANGFVAGNCRCRMSYSDSLTASAQEDTLMSTMTLSTTAATSPTSIFEVTTTGGIVADPLTAGIVVTITEVEDDAGEVDDTTEDGGEAMAWKALLAIEGQATEDGRIIDVGALTWRDLPLSLMAMDETGPGGHEGAQVSGRIDTIERQGSEIWGAGVFDTGEFGQKICRMVGEQTLRGNSVDLAVLAYEYRNADTGAVLNDEDLMDAFFGDIPILFAVTEGVIMASTVCPTPAIAGAEIMLASGVMMMTFSFVQESGDVLTAAGAGMAPLHPPTDWFSNPNLDRPTGMTVTPEGKVFGHAALWDSCHIGEPSGPGICVPPPRSGMQYEIFHHGVVTTDDGTDIPCGQITMSTFHAGRDLSWKATLEHYEHSGCAVADVVAGEDAHGIWVSGGLRPDLPAERVREMKAGALSGDWRQVIGRGLEFLAALVVNIPGFPIPRPEARIVASALGEEEVLALIAAGMVTEEDIEGMSRREYLRKIAVLTH